MSKERISATVDEDVAAYLSQDHINTSGLVNDLVKQYMEGGDGQAAIMRLREEQIKSELEALNQQREAKEKELKRLTESRQEVESGPDIAHELDEILTQMEREGTHYWPYNGEIQSLAIEAGTDGDEIIHRLKAQAVEQDRNIYHTQFKRADRVRGEQRRPIAEVFDGE